MKQWIYSLIKSFGYAFQGIVYVVATQRNMKIHVFAATVVLVAAITMKMKANDVLILIGTITFVMMAEIFNTAIEKTVDLVIDQFHPLAKAAKDVAAGAVFLAASLSVIVGVHIFYPYIFPDSKPLHPVIYIILFLILLAPAAGKAIHNGKD